MQSCRIFRRLFILGGLEIWGWKRFVNLRKSFFPNSKRPKEEKARDEGDRKRGEPTGRRNDADAMVVGMGVDCVLRGQRGEEGELCVAGDENS